MVRFYKVLGTSANLLMFYLTWRWFHDGLSLEFGLGCLIISLYAVVFTQPQLRHLFRTFFNLKSRLQVLIPMVWSIVFAGMALASLENLWVSLAAAATLGYWGYIYYKYRRNQRRHYFKQGHGPLPMGAWVNPPKQLARPGVVMLTSGCVAEKERQSVGHAEIIVELDGQLMLVSSWMGKGMVINPLERIFKEGEHHWVLLPPKQEWPREKIDLAERSVKAMRLQQDQYIVRNRARRDWILARLPLPATTIESLRKKFPIDGYNWWGLISSHRTKDQWTCSGLVYELQWRIGLPFQWLGTLFFGFGPFAADRLLDEPSLYLLEEKHRIEFEAEQAAKGVAVVQADEAIVQADDAVVQTDAAAEPKDGTIE